MSAYYNENDPYCAAWLRNLIGAGLIAPGDVDERSIVDVRADDLRGFTQCHFFAGIGGWSYALRLAGWPDAKLIWTGSCPCQSLSVAGKRKGHADKRHLWPALYGLIAERRPAIFFGEQVASKDGREWLSAVRADFEAAGYAIGAANLSAECVGAPHERQRLYFTADRAGATANGGDQDGRRGWRAGEMEEARASPDSHKTGSARRQVEPRIRQAEIALNRCSFIEAWQGWNGGFGGFGRVDDGIPKGVAKRVVGGFGNAIVPQVAAEFIMAASPSSTQGAVDGSD